ncbi:hypothetical protein [Streptomyces sp. NPDC048309]|uniref:hypothetical protein n=1 Tax=unclassified Streptomyces TaxID=2593676 RepID=UPI0033DE6C07
MRHLFRAVCTSAVFATLGFVAYTGPAVADGDIGWPVPPRPAAAAAQHPAHDIGWPAAL